MIIGSLLLVGVGVGGGGHAIPTKPLGQPLRPAHLSGEAAPRLSDLRAPRARGRSPGGGADVQVPGGEHALRGWEGLGSDRGQAPFSFKWFHVRLENRETLHFSGFLQMRPETEGRCEGLILGQVE